MRRFLLLCSQATLVVLLGAAAHRSSLLPTLVATRSPGNAIQGVTLTLEHPEASQARLHFALCGPDVTQIPSSGLPLTFGFDTAIQQVTGDAGQTGLAMSAQVNGPAATVSLKRDPFTPPEAWHITLVIALAQRPGTGQLTISPFPAYDFTGALAAASEAETVILGGRCQDRYATRAE